MHRSTRTDLIVFKESSDIPMGNVGGFLSNLKIYNPPHPPTYSHSSEIVMVTTIGGYSVACKAFSPFSVANCVEPFKCILFSHGNSDDIGSCSSYCQWLADSLNCRVVTYDYPGYGVSCNEDTNVASMNCSIEAVYGYCISTLDILPENILLMGSSLGSVSTIHLATQPYTRDIVGVILISPLASGARVVLGSKRLSATLMSFMDDYFAPNVKIIKGVSVPVFIVHGTRDTVIAIQNSHDLSNALPSKCAYPPLWVEAGHNDIEVLHKGLFISSISSFIQYCVSMEHVV